MKDILKLIPNSQKNNFYLIILFLFFSSFVEIIGIGLIPIFVSFLIDPIIFLSKVNSSFLNNLFNKIDKTELVIYSSLILCLVFIFKNLFFAFLIYFEANFIKNIKKINSKKIFENHIFSPYKFHLDKNPSMIIRSVTIDVEQSANYIKNFTLLTKELLVLFLIAILLIWNDPKITTSIFIILSLFSFLFFYLIRNKLKKRGKLNVELNEQLIKIVSQSFNAIKDVKLFSKEKYLTEIHEKNYSKLQQNHLISFFLTSLPRLFLEILAITSIICVILYLYLSKGNIISSLPLITLMSIASIRLIPCFNSITKSLSSMKYNLASFNLILEMFYHLNNFKTNNTKSEEVDNIEFNNKIELKNVFFKYENTNQFIIEDNNIEINKNSKIAIVGKSGSGKTTIVDMIIGLLEPSKGYVLVDDKIVYGNDNWKKKIGYIPQNFYLFDDTIKRNVAFGIPDKEIDLEKVKEALKFAKLDEFVCSLKNQYETRVGNQGIMLSGGQKQRIIIARAAYNNPDVLILDEATSAIDEEVEKEFIDNLIKMSSKKTLVIISHRSSTIENCNEIYKIKDKKLFKLK